MSYPGSPPPDPAYQPGAAVPPPQFTPPPPAFAPTPPYGTAPLSGPPFSGPPVSGPAGFGYPTTAVPAAPRRSPAVLVLAALTAIFFLVAVLFTTLYVTKNGAYNKQVKLVSQRDKTVSDELTQINDLKTQLQSTKDQLNDAQQRQSGTQNQLDEMTKEKQTIANCLNLYNKVVNALLNNDKNTFNATFPSMKTACDDAAKYVN
jgi:hypothetical protein